MDMEFDWEPKRLVAALVLGLIAALIFGAVMASDFFALLMGGATQ